MWGRVMESDHHGTSWDYLWSKKKKNSVTVREDESRMAFVSVWWPCSSSQQGGLSLSVSPQQQQQHQETARVDTNVPPADANSEDPRSDPAALKQRRRNRKQSLWKKNREAFKTAKRKPSLTIACEYWLLPQPWFICWYLLLFLEGTESMTSCKRCASIRDSVSVKEEMAVLTKYVGLLSHKHTDSLCSQPISSFQLMLDFRIFFLISL